MQLNKFKKLLKKPHLFIRDYLNNKYPVNNGEVFCDEKNEPIIIQSQDKLLSNLPVLDNNTKPVDVVFTWVDNSDVKWLAKYNKFKPKENILPIYSADKARFTQYNELYYATLSVQKYLPWVRNIYIVTDNQTPKWLSKWKQNKHNMPVYIVDHSEIIESKYLPTFNSHVIEANLHKIKGLSENFIYFNDDVFVARPLKENHFFQNNGLSSLFLTNKNLSKISQKQILTATLYASKNAAKLLYNNYNALIDITLVHSYIPLKKSMYELAWSKFNTQIEDFLSNKFRDKNDLNLATFLVPYLSYLEGKAMPMTDICYYFNIRSNHAPAQYKKLLNKTPSNTPHSFCANDFNSNNSIKNYDDKLNEFLESYFNIGE